MGWYHYEIMNGNHSSDPSAPASPDGTCPLPPSPASCPDGTCPLPDPTRDAAEQEEIYKDKGPVYHLCQRSNWLQATQSHEAYFPPTFWLDGRFTRASCVRDVTLVHTANHYNKNVAGDWLCLELDPAVLRKLGISIAVHRAPETAADGQPACCLKLYGGISVCTPGLVSGIYALERGAGGLFVGMLPDDVSPRFSQEVSKVKENQSEASSVVTTNSKLNGIQEHTQVTEDSRRPPRNGFWKRFQSKK